MPYFLLVLALFGLDEPPMAVTVARDANGNRILADAAGFVVTTPDYGGPRIVGYWSNVTPFGLEPRDGAKANFIATSYGPDVIDVFDNMDDEYFGLALEDSVRLFDDPINDLNAAKLERLGSPKHKVRAAEAKRIAKEKDMGPLVWGRFSRDAEVRYRAEAIWVGMKRRLHGE